MNDEIQRKTKTFSYLPTQKAYLTSDTTQPSVCHYFKLMSNYKILAKFRNPYFVTLFNLKF